jgi:hypothetical protein
MRSSIKADLHNLMENLSIMKLILNTRQTLPRFTTELITTHWPALVALVLYIGVVVTGFSSLG